MQTGQAGVISRTGQIQDTRADSWGHGHPRPARSGVFAGLFTSAISSLLALLAFPLLTVLKSAKAQRILLAVAVFNIAFQVEKHFFRQEEASNLGSLGGLQVSVTGIAFTILILAWFVGVTVGSRTITRPLLGRNVIAVPGVLMVLVYLTSSFVAIDIRLALFQVCSLCVLLSMLVYIAAVVRSRADVLFIVRILLVGLIFQCGLMLAQAAGWVGEIQFYFIRTVPGAFMDGRVIGTQGSANMAAAYVAMLMPLALGLLLGNAGRGDKYLAGLGLSLAAISLIFTGSRGGWISLVISIATILVFGGRRISWKFVAVVLVVLVLLAIPFANTIKDRLFGDDNGSAASRIPLSQIAMVVIKDNPVLGVGANNYPLVMGHYAVRGGFLGTFEYSVHNTYLLTWAETGIGGLMVLLWFLFAVIRQGIRCWDLHDPLFGPIALGCAAAVLGLLAHLGVDIFRTGSAVDLLWLFGGLLIAMSRISADDSSGSLYLARSSEVSH